MSLSEWDDTSDIFCPVDSLAIFLEPFHEAISQEIDPHEFDCTFLPIPILTPPLSDNGSVGAAIIETELDPNAADRTVISISSTFHPGANLLPIPADLLLMSSDGVFFYIHLTQVLGASTNYFNNILCADRSKPDGPSADDSVNPVTCVAEIASVLNVVLHSAYNISCANYVPALDVLVAAAGALPLYGLAPKKYIAPSTSLYQLILAQAPVQPMKVYALASRHDLYELAKPVSSHLLAFPLENLTDDVASTVDAVYLKRLSSLHLGRLAALKNMLLPAPYPHPATEECTFVDQRHLARAWSLTSSYLAWVSRPDVSPQVIGDACSSLSPHLCCPLCKRGLAVRIKDLLARWSFAQRTI